MLKILTHKVSPQIVHCELTFLDRIPIDFDVATYQHERYCNTLRELGASVVQLTNNIEYADSCFIEDTAIVLNEVAVLCSLGVPSRHNEVNEVRHELEKYRTVVPIMTPATIEGGDVLRIGKTIFVGLSSRTNELGAKELARIVDEFGYTVIPVETRKSLHLKTACTAIDDETILMNPEWIDAKIFQGYKTIETPTEEPWGANVLRIGETVSIQAAFTRTIEIVERIAKRVVTIDTSELGKAEGALTCLSLVFNE
jgi:dimethylargininase